MKDGLPPGKLWSIRREPEETYDAVRTRILSTNSKRLSQCNDLNSVIKITSLSRFIAILPAETTTYVKTAKSKDIREAARLAADHEEIMKGQGPWQPLLHRRHEHRQDTALTARNQQQGIADDGQPRRFDKYKVTVVQIGITVL